MAARLAAGRSASRTCSRSNHSPYGRRVAISRFDLLVGDDPPALEVDEEELPGLQPPLAQRRAPGGTSSTPVSEASTTQPSRVSSQRPGRRPLRSSVAPISVPSVNAIAAGPSHASVRHSWKRVEAAQLVARRRRGRRTPRGSSSSARAAASGRRARAARARCRTSPSRSRRAGRPAAPSRRSSPKSSDASCDSRARIQLTLPRSVLISPLCAISRYGCASSQLGNVFVEKREWTSASALATRSSREVGEVARELRRRRASPCRRASAPRSSG